MDIVSHNLCGCEISLFQSKEGGQSRTVNPKPSALICEGRLGPNGFPAHQASAKHSVINTACGSLQHPELRLPLPPVFTGSMTLQHPFMPRPPLPQGVYVTHLERGQEGEGLEGGDAVGRQRQDLNQSKVHGTWTQGMVIFSIFDNVLNEQAPEVITQNAVAGTTAWHCWLS